MHKLDTTAATWPHVTWRKPGIFVAQGGYVKGLLTIGWCVWAFNSASTKVSTCKPACASCRMQPVGRRRHVSLCPTVASNRRQPGPLVTEPAFAGAAVQVYTAESIWHAEAARAEGALKALEDTRADMESQLAKVRVAHVTV